MNFSNDKHRSPQTRRHRTPSDILKPLEYNCFTKMKVHCFGDKNMQAGAFTVGVLLWDKGLKDYVAVDLGVYHDLLLFDQ